MLGFPADAATTGLGAVGRLSWPAGHRLVPDRRGRTPAVHHPSGSPAYRSGRGPGGRRSAWFVARGEHPGQDRLHGPGGRAFAAWPDLAGWSARLPRFRGLRAFGSRTRGVLRPYRAGGADRGARRLGIGVTVLGPSGSASRRSSTPACCRGSASGPAWLWCSRAVGGADAAAVAGAGPGPVRPAGRDLVERRDIVTELAARLEQDAVGEVVSTVLQRRGADQLACWWWTSSRRRSAAPRTPGELRAGASPRARATLAAAAAGRPARRLPRPGPPAAVHRSAGPGPVAGDGGGADQGSAPECHHGSGGAGQVGEYEPGLVDRLLQDVGYAPGGCRWCSSP